MATRDQNRRFNLKSRYGMDEEDFLSILAAQGNRCAICGVTDPPGRGWHVDHDHQGQYVRGILCSSCNLGLGHFRDSPENLAAAQTYLRLRKYGG